MLRFVARRLLQMIPLLIGITFLSFVVVDLAPGDFFSTLRMNPSISPDLVREMEVEFGYGEPLLVRYGRWLWRVVHLDLGMSIAYRVAVVDLIGARALNTLILAVASMAFTWALAIPLGVIVALRRGSATDRALSFMAFFGMSVPSFFLAFLLMYLALETGWFPVGGTTSLDYALLGPWDRLADRAEHLVLPVLVLGTSGMASLMRLMRSNVLEIKNADYVRTARAKGLPEWQVVGKHILRNALNPFVTLAGYELGTLLGGAALVEAVMNLQGLGTLMLDAVRALDLYLVMGSVLMSAVLLLLGNLVADVALTLVDPRIDFAKLEAARG
jgi:peptide/nickel transport system permease protein